ncbi:MAG: poly-gamma-glutamate system protein [Planctomycetales bacterium]|nr:poly-gamma-glutamate system protein [Planctomycetales bacterium]
MKKVYWRPKAVSRTGLVLIAATALAGLFLVEHFKIVRQQPQYDLKLKAAKLAAEAMEAIYYERVQLQPEIDPSTDTTESGMVGLPMSEVTSIAGDLTAKQASVNPNFAAVVVEMLQKAKVNKGDVVAVGVTGSFPALNACVYSALETMETKPIVIASAAASQWGANHPDLLWIDMERLLASHGIIKTRAVACSIGGYEDRGLGLSPEGSATIEQAIKENGLLRLESKSFEEAIDERMHIYRQQAKGRPIKAYINVGGGTISVGRSLGKKMFKPGVNFRPPGRLQRIDGIMPRFITQDVPCIHLVQVSQIAEEYGLPVPPDTMPEPGNASVFSAVEYRKAAAAALLALLVGMMYTFVRSDVGHRLLKLTGKPKTDALPEPMV